MPAGVGYPPPSNVSGDRTAAMRAFVERQTQRGGTPPVSSQTPSPATQSPSSPQGQPSGITTATSQLQKSQPGEAEIIIKALVQRLRSLTPTQAQ